MDIRVNCVFLPNRMYEVLSLLFSVTLMFGTSRTNLWILSAAHVVLKPSPKTHLIEEKYRSRVHSHDYNFWSGYKWECLFQELHVDLESSGDVLVLSSVSRKDSGIYQCHPLDADGNTEVKGEMQLTVHCKDDHSKKHKHILTRITLQYIFNTKESWELKDFLLSNIKHAHIARLKK